MTQLSVQNEFFPAVFWRSDSSVLAPTSELKVIASLLVFDTDFLAANDDLHHFITNNFVEMSAFAPE